MMDPRYVRPAIDMVDLAASTAADFVALYGDSVTVRARTAGNLVCVTAAGESRTIAVVADEEIPVRIKSVTAANAVALRVYIWG